MRDAGELALLREIRRRVGRRARDVLVSIGDDACLLRDGSVLTIDGYVQGVHFRLDYMSMRDVGRRLACAALSDLAAMAARPAALVVALVLPPRFRTEDISRLYRGLDDVCRRFGVEVCGGDVSAGGQFVVVIAALGKTKHRLLRSTARIDDAVYVTGWLGLGETGRLVLKHGLDRRSFPASVRRHLLPWPRIEEALDLATRAHAAIDLSDGVSTDAGHIAAESRVALELWPDRFPIHKETRRLVRSLGLDPTGFVLAAGEDYELLLTGPAQRVGRRRSLRPRTKLTPVGRVVCGRGVWLCQNDRRSRLRPSGYEHFSRRRPQNRD